MGYHVAKQNFLQTVIETLLFWYIYLLKNSLAVKKGAALFKMASVKIDLKSKMRQRNGCDCIG